LALLMMIQLKRTKWQYMDSFTKFTSPNFWETYLEMTPQSPKYGE
jgi:hypothetical protein